MLFFMAVGLWACTADPLTEEEAIDIERDLECNPFAMGDDCLLPYPSLHVTREDEGSETGLRLDYSLDMFWSPNGGLPVDPVMFNHLDGVSPATQALITLGTDVDPAQLLGHGQEETSISPDYPIAIVHVKTGERVPLLTEMDQTNRQLSTYDHRHPLILRPVFPLVPGDRYVVGLHEDLVAVDGSSFESPAAFAALRDDVLSTDAEVESLRDRYDDALFPALEAAGFPREALLVAWEFQVASESQLLGPIKSMREQAQEAIAEDGMGYTITEIESAPTDQVAYIVKGTFDPPNFLDDNALVLSEDSYEAVIQDERPTYGFTMVVPEDLPPDQAVPLVVFGHGIFGSHGGYLTGSSAEDYIYPFAYDLGLVVIATDWIGLSEGDLDLILEEVIPDLSRITIVTDRLAQSLVNNLALVELARDDLSLLPELDRDYPLIDPEILYYYGISLGGIQGASFVSLHPDVSRAVLSVPGAGWSNMIQRSWHFSQIELLLDALYPDPLTQVLFISALQGYFDTSDPVNLGRLVLERDTELTVVIQEAIGDCQVPNLATDLLVRTMAAAHLEESTDAVYGLSTIEGPAADTVSLTQFRLPEALESYLPPDENTIPDQNNNTHSDAPTTTAAMAQVAELLESGLAVHPCEGPCDPD